jgi:hypothetical protein
MISRGRTHWKCAVFFPASHLYLTRNPAHFQCALRGLCREMAFVGGCTTALMLTDAVSRESVRFTDDVDLIIHVLGLQARLALLEALKQKGFTQSSEDEVMWKPFAGGAITIPCPAVILKTF